MTDEQDRSGQNLGLTYDEHEAPLPTIGIDSLGTGESF